jgi:single-strand DNA-binding protein
MARGKNITILIGHVGADPTVVMRDGKAFVSTINLATTEAWKDKDTDEKQERTEWHRVKFFGRRAETVAEFVKKGTLLFVEGRLRTDKYTDDKGVDRYNTEVIGDDFEMLSAARPAADASERA